MTRIHRTALAASVLALSALGCSPADPQGATPAPVAASGTGAADTASGEIAAELSGVPITTDELDEWIKEDLFESRANSPAKLYELRQGSLETMLAERIVASEADRRGVSREELIELEVKALGPVTDEAIQQFYEENSRNLSGATLDQVSDRIRDYLQSRQRVEVVAALRGKADVVIHLDAPRIQVAATGPSRGPEDARITIVEFSDFQCPFCRRVIPTLDEVLEKYPNDVRVVYRNMPLGNHSRAQPAAEAALCAEEQGKFWAYHDLLFENTRQLSDEDLLRYATEVGLDTEKFSECFEEERFASQVEEDAAAGRKAGVSGTPAFFVNGILLSGARPAADFFRTIDAELARLEKDQG